MIRICHIITGLYTGGAEMMLYKLLSRTDRTRFEPFVVSLIDQGELGERIEALGIPVYVLGMRAHHPSIAAASRLYRRIRECRPQLIQGWMYHGNLAATVAARFLPERPPVLWNVRQTFYARQREKPSTRWTIRLSAPLSGTARFIVYNSKLSAEQHEEAGFRGERRVILPNGFDGEAFAPSPAERSRWRKALGYEAHQIVIGLVARYHPMKNHETFLRAAAILAGRYESARFILAGRGVDNDNATLNSVIRALRLNDRVSLLGERRDMAALFQALDLAALASAWGESFPNVLGEAMASGVPCVTTDVGEAAEIVGETGRVVPPRDPEAMAAALAELVALGPDGRADLGIRARERILRHYALPAIAARYEGMYLEALGLRKGT